MSNGLDLYTAKSLATSQTAGAGAAMDIGALSFERESTVHPADVPQRARGPFEPFDLPPYAQAWALGVCQAKPRKDAGGLAQTRTFWHAWPDKVVVSQVMRRLTPRPDGKLQADRWGIARQELWSLTGVQQSKLVGPDPAVPTTGGPSSQASPSEAELAQATLPAVARAWLNKTVPEPTWFEGSVLHWDGPAPRHTIDVLRADTRTVAVVHAARAEGSVAWTVTRLGSPLLRRTVREAAEHLALEG